MVRAGLGRPDPWSAEHGEAALRANQPLPPKIQQVLRARLAQLSPTAQSLAELVAVSGRACHYAVLARAYDGDEASLVHALDELWRRRILREMAGDSYDFTHEKLREACYDGMSAARRRLAHRRVAEAVEAVGASFSATEESSPVSVQTPNSTERTTAGSKWAAVRPVSPGARV
jgi:predicted ATPase